MELLLGSPHRTHVLALLDAGEIRAFERWEADEHGEGGLPERAAAFLKTHQLTFEDLKGLVVVTGPGSYTFSRGGVVTANTFRFVHQLPLLALNRLQLAFLAARVTGQLAHQQALAVIRTIHDSFFTATGAIGAEGMPKLTYARLNQEQLVERVQGKILLAEAAILDVEAATLLFQWDQPGDLTRMISLFDRLPRQQTDAEPCYLVEPNIKKL